MGLRRRGVCAKGTGSRGVARLPILALLVTAWLLFGCAAQSGTSLRYGEVLRGPEVPLDVAEKIRRPSADCVERAGHFIVRWSDLYDEPLPARLRDRSAAVLRGLHPTAKQVLRRTGSVWFARDLPGADARFIPCDAEGDGAGLILLDASAHFSDRVRDADMPYLYWRLLGGTTAADHSLHSAKRPGHHALRYVLLHELGHALSLFAGEFSLGPDRQFDVGSWDGFLGFSWRARNARSFGDELHDGGGVVPAGLAFQDWRRIRRALDASATWLAPGYRRPRGGDPTICSMVYKLPRAGFVTPTAAIAPTEDYAELFAHAILADEGKLHPDDVIEVTLDGCPTRSVPPPYFAPGVYSKRTYIERQLEL